MRLLLTVALATILLAACGDRATDNNSAAECSADRDCDGDKVCRAGLCTVAERSPRALGFRLAPPPASTYPAQTVAIRQIPPDEAVQIGIDPGVRVAGSLPFVGLEAGPTGRLKFRRHGDEFASETAVTNSEYEIFVPAGTYDITFFPTDVERRPTRVWNDVVIELDTDPRLQIVEMTVEVIGTLSRTDAVSGESEVVRNARVFATATANGVTSSVATTDESGNFTIAVPPDSGTFDLHVAPAEPNTYAEDRDSGDYVPDATYPGAFTVDGVLWANQLDDNQGADVLGVSLGEYAYTPIRIPVRLTIEGEDVEDWSGTSVTLRTTAGRGVISVRQRLEESGEFEIPLIVGLYDAVISTPPALPARSMELSGIEIGPDGIVLRLQARTNVSGVVRGPDGTPVRGAELRFVPTRSGGLAQQVSTTTDDDGKYAIWLEDDPYTLSVVPTDPALPRLVTIVENADVPDVIEIGEPVLVWGTVFGTPSNSGEQQWVGLADVSVHVVEADADGAVRVIGEAQTNESGDFKTVIAARP